MPRKATKRQTKKQRVQKLKVKKQRIGVWSGISAVATLLAFLALIPRVTAGASDPTDPSNPFSSAVTVENTGFLPLDSVNVHLGINYIKFVNQNGKTTTVVGHEESGTELAFTGWSPRDLRMDDRFSVLLSDAFSGPKQAVLGAEITVIVQYELPLIHIRREKHFPLKTERTGDGNFHWLADVWPRPSER